MKFILKINGSEDKNAEFVGWTPVKCTLTVDGYNSDTPMLVTITPEHKNKSGRIDLYCNNATSAPPLTEIKHDFQTANELTFYVAGKFGNASVAEKDTYILVKHQSDKIPELKKDMMVRVRKNANKLSDDEIIMFLEAFVRLNTKEPQNVYQGDYTKTPNKLLHEIVLMHTLDAQYEIHQRTSFHPWHRIFQMHLERELQMENPCVTIPYWKFDEKADRVFTSKFIGETEKNKNDPEKNKPKFDKMNPLINYVEHTIWGPLQRAYNKRNPANTDTDETDSLDIYTQKRIINCSDSSEYFLYWSQFEERKSHNRAHNVFTGHVADVARDPIDPLFFMMHSNVDRLWALWQEKHNRYDADNVNTYPFQRKYAGERGKKWASLETKNQAEGIYQVNNDDIGNFVEDTLWPWNWDNILSRPMRKWESTDTGYGTGEVPQINIQFPKSPTSDYPDGPITVGSTIDYQGKLKNKTPLGFDYDDIPYFDHDKKRSAVIALAEVTDKGLFEMSMKMHNHALEELRNKDNDLSTRITAIASIDETSEDFVNAILEVIEDPSEPKELRAELIDYMLNAKRSNRFFPSRKARFFDQLRGLIKDTNKELRLKAIDILAANEDPIVQEFLIEEIKKERRDFISITDAIFFLRQSPKPQHNALFREVFKASVNPEMRKAAIEALGNDPESVGLLKEVVTDTNESFKVREAGALSLHNLNYELMNDLAAQIIAETEHGEGIKLFRSASPNPDEVDFKAGLLNMLTFTGDPKKLKYNKKLKSSLQEVVNPNTPNKANFRSNMELFDATSTNEQTIIEKLAKKLLDRLDINSNE